METRFVLSEAAVIIFPVRKMMLVSLLCSLLPGTGEMYVNCASEDNAMMQSISGRIKRRGLIIAI